MSAEVVNAASMAFTKALIERALDFEFSHHQSCPPRAEKLGEVSNHRNAVSYYRTVLRNGRPLCIDVPPDLPGGFEHRFFFRSRNCALPVLTTMSSPCTRAACRVVKFRGWQISFGTEASPEFIGSVTNVVMAEVSLAIAVAGADVSAVFVDALRVKIREEASVRPKANHPVLGIQSDGRRDILGWWIKTTEGAKS